MSKVYESLKEVVQETLHRKVNSVTLARLKGRHASTLNDEMEDLERIIVDRISRLRTAVKDGEEVIEEETSHAQQTIANLQTKIVELEAKLRDTRESLRKKTAASQKMEESQAAKILDMQSEMKKKDELVESRAREGDDLKSKVDVLMKQVTKLDLVVEQARGEAARESERAEHLTEISKKGIAALETKLRQAEEILRGRETTIKALEQNLAHKTQNLDAQETNHKTLLADRDKQINDLQAQLKILTGGIKNMSSFFRQAEVLAAVETKDINVPLSGKESQHKNGELGASHVKDRNVPSRTAPPAQEHVSSEVFDRLSGELTRVIGPMAPLVISGHVAACGESMEKFPKGRLTELLEILSKEILDKNLRSDFQSFARHL